MKPFVWVVKVISIIMLFMGLMHGWVLFFTNTFPIDDFMFIIITIPTWAVIVALLLALFYYVGD